MSYYLNYYTKVTDYSNLDKYAIIIACAKVEDYFKLAKVFPNLFITSMLIELQLLREVNSFINSMPISEWFSSWNPSDHKFDQQMNHILDRAEKSVHIYSASNNKGVVIMLYMVKQNYLDKPRFAIRSCLKNLDIYTKQTTRNNINARIELVVIYAVWRKKVF